MKKLPDTEVKALLSTIKSRFEQNMNRHPGMNWSAIADRLLQFPEKLWSLQEMENSGGEPDIVDHDQQTGAFVFFDCAPESPKGRRSICYDQQALASRKENKPANSAVHMAETMGISILNEAQYRHLQQLGNFDLKTSSWIDTPTAIRALGGALFCDRRYNTVFTYHNGAESYYAARGFRASLSI